MKICSRPKRLSGSKNPLEIRRGRWGQSSSFSFSFFFLFSFFFFTFLFQPTVRGELSGLNYNRTRSQSAWKFMICIAIFHLIVSAELYARYTLLRMFSCGKFYLWASFESIHDINKIKVTRFVSFLSQLKISLSYPLFDDLCCKQILSLLISLFS